MSSSYSDLVDELEENNKRLELIAIAIESLTEEVAEFKYAFSVRNP